MDTNIVKGLCKKPYITIPAAIAFGALCGVVADLVYSKVKGVKDDDVETESTDEEESSEDEEDRYSDEDEEQERPQVSFAFKKPSLEEYVDYTKFARSYKDEEESEEDFEERPSMIHIITEEEFVRDSGSPEGYASAVGMWFPEEKILAGWNDSLEEKVPAQTIGEEALDILEKGAQAVYVRNDLLKVLYEIVKAEDSWEEAVLDAASHQD